jgi:hypothetical protein
MNNYKKIHLLIILILACLSGCSHHPVYGKKFVLQVIGIPASRQAIEDSPGLNLAIQNGMSTEQMKEGRLLKTGCYIESSANKNSVRRFGFTLIPENIELKEGDTILISAEEAGEGNGEYDSFFGKYIKKYNALESDYFEYQYSNTGKAFRCTPISENNQMTVEIYSKVKFWDYELAEAEIIRNKLISDEELAEGRIVSGECSPSVDSWYFYNVRIPEKMNVKPGDYIEAVAGAPSTSYKTGNVSLAIRKIVKPPKSDFIYTHGRLTVDCLAKTRIGY